MEVGDENLKRFFSQTLSLLDERERRLMAAAVVEMLGRGGQAAVSRATGMSSLSALDRNSDHVFLRGHAAAL